MLYDNEEFEIAHQSVAELGDTRAPSASEGDRSVILPILWSIYELIVYHRLGQHFVSFVKEDGRLWELEGNRVSNQSIHLLLSIPPLVLQSHSANEETERSSRQRCTCA